VYDNGVVRIAPVYGELLYSLNSRTDFDLYTILIGQYGKGCDYNVPSDTGLVAMAVGLALICLSGVVLFRPAINKARSERETSLRAFLEIPKPVVEQLFLEFYEQNAYESKDNDNLTEDTGFMSDRRVFMDDSEIVNSVKNGDGYLTQTVVYIKGLCFVSISILIAFSTLLPLALRIKPLPSVLVNSLSIQHSSTVISLVAEDIARGYSTFKNALGSSRAEINGSELLNLEANSIQGSLAAIIYGFKNYGDVISLLDSKAEEDLGFPPSWASNDDAVFDLAYSHTFEFIEKTYNVASLFPSTTESPAYKELRSLKMTLDQQYNAFFDHYYAFTIQQIDHLYRVSAAMLGMVLFSAVIAYIFFWRPFLTFLIDKENERTLKLLLMIPYEIVTDIDSLRKLLHLKKIIHTNNNSESLQQAKLATSRDLLQGVKSSSHGSMNKVHLYRRRESAVGVSNFYKPETSHLSYENPQSNSNHTRMGANGGGGSSILHSRPIEDGENDEQQTPQQQMHFIPSIILHPNDTAPAKHGNNSVQILVDRSSSEEIVNSHRIHHSHLAPDDDQHGHNGGNITRRMSLGVNGNTRANVGMSRRPSFPGMY
jgi:hypothetical protein